jgi:hypothetical protein
MFVSGGGVHLGLVVLTGFVVMGRLVMMMSRSIVVRGGIMVGLRSGMLGLFGHNRSPGCRLGGASVSCWKAAWSTPPLFTISATLVPSSRICHQADRKSARGNGRRHADRDQHEVRRPHVARHRGSSERRRVRHPHGLDLVGDSSHENLEPVNKATRLVGSVEVIPEVQIDFRAAEFKACI